MKPSALTQAARKAVSSGQQAARGQRQERHRRPTGGARTGRSGPGASPRRRPRRVSGPLRATERLSLSLSAAREAALALPLRPLGGHSSAPRAERERPVQRPRGRPALRGRLRSFVVSLPDHSWLDRVVRGRVWIPLLGVLLAGIVAAQVEILKLNASMGRSLEQNGTLTTENQLLQQSVASLSDDQRIERLATGMGMVAPPPGAVGFLPGRPGGEVGGALGNLHAPNPSSFLIMAPTNGAVVTGSGASTLPSTSAPVVPTPTLGTPPATTTTTTTTTPTPAATATTTTTTTPTPAATATGGSATSGAGSGAASTSPSQTGGG